MSNRLGLTAAQIRQLMARQEGGIPSPTGKRNLDDLNGTERDYLETVLLPDQTVVDIWPHGIRLVLGDNSRYEPDFLVMRSDGRLEIHEVKQQIKWHGRTMRGHDDSRQKVKSTATLFPFPVIIASKIKAKDGGGWHVERFDPQRRHIENRPPAADTATPETPNVRRQSRLRVVPGATDKGATPVVQSDLRG